MSKLRKVSPKRALACLLALFALLTVFTALAETQAEEPAQAAEQVEQVAEEAAATAVEILRLQIAPGLKPRALQTQAHGGAHIAQLLLRNEQGQGLGRNAYCNHIANRRLRS